MLHLFVSAADEYGLPLHVRADRGDENILVSQYMLCHPQRGPPMRSFIAGRSVHNQKIVGGCFSWMHITFLSPFLPYGRNWSSGC